MITIRKAQISDIDILHDLIMAIAKHHDQEQYVLTNKVELAKSGFAESPSFGVLLAEMDDEIAGYCSYTWNYSIWLGSTYMNIDDLFVWEKFRGKLLGEKLMYKAKEICLADGIKRIRLEVEQDNHSAIKFYQRLGANFDVKGVFRWEFTS